MRLFIALEEKSTIQPYDIQPILRVHCRRDDFEILPVDSAGFPPVRTQENRSQTLAAAWQETYRIAAHYPIDLQAVVFVFKTKGLMYTKGRPIEVSLDVALALRPRHHSLPLEELRFLNDEDGWRLPSSFDSKPRLIEALMDFALIDVAGLYADSPSAPY